MTTVVNLGIWDRAPFQNAISRSVSSLNEYLENSNYDARYEIMPIKYENIGKLKTLPDVFILDGGEDVNPARYGELNRASFFSEYRDEIEFGFAAFMDARNVRLSGVCRGHQLLNVHFGGSLHQDIREAQLYTPGLKHTSGHKAKLPRHLGKKLVLKDFVGKHNFTVSSLHHQAVKDIASKFLISLVWEVRPKRRNYYKETSESGYIIEGIERYDGRVRGLQCHPEFRGFPKDGLMFAYLMHVDNFIHALQTPTDEQIQAKFSHLIASEKVIKKRNAVGPFKVHKGGLRVGDNVGVRIRRETRDERYAEENYDPDR
jgi:gamma-glutamyl-gamma-aminobutyrate hydrolase PuuD